MLEIVLTPHIFEPPKIGALGLSLFSLMVNPRLDLPEMLRGIRTTGICSLTLFVTDHESH